MASVINIVESVAYRAWLLRLAFPTVTAVEVAREVKTAYPSLNAVQMTQVMKHTDPTPIYPELSAQDMSLILIDGQVGYASAEQVAQGIHQSDHYPDMNALDCGKLIMQLQLFAGIDAAQMQASLEFAGFDHNEVELAVAQLFPPPIIVLDSPTGLTLYCDYTTGIVSASWQPITLPDSLHGKTPTYTIALFTLQDQQTSVCIVPNVTNQTTELSLGNGQPFTNNQQYVAQVKTVVDAIESGWSSVCAPVTYMIFAAPQRVSIVDGDINTIMLSWPPLNGVTNMELIMLDGNNNPLNPQPQNICMPDKAKIDVSELPFGAITYIIVRGLYSVPTAEKPDQTLPGPWSKALTFTKPETPQNLAYSHNDGKVNVSWQMNNQGISEYIVQLIDASNNVFWTVRTNIQLVKFDSIPPKVKLIRVTAYSNIIKGGDAQIPFDSRQPAGWYQATPEAQFQDLNLPVVLNMNGKIFAFAGQYQNSVFSSDDGVHWACVNSKAPWPGRRCAAAVVFDDVMWLFGGDTLQGDANDVWISPDGVNWKCVMPNAPWGPRNGLCAVVFQKQMWIFGGTDHRGNVYNDVWTSIDGYNWGLVNSQANWSQRDSAAAAVYQNRIYIMGGSSSGNSLNDVWSSDNGRDWAPHGNVPWMSRFWGQAAVIGNNMYLVGGTNTKVRDLNDMWMTQDGISWNQVTEKAPWGPRMLQGLTVFNDRIYLLGGIVNNTSDNSVWYYSE